VSLLDAAHLFDRTLPEASAWVLEALFELDELKGGSALTKDDRRKRAQALYRRLLDGLEPLREPTPPEHGRDSPSFRQWFTEAVLLWIRFAKSGSAPLIDTVGSETLKTFPVDLPLDDAGSVRVREAVMQAFDWTPDDFAAVERRIEHMTSNLELKRSITQALAAHLREAGRLDDAGRLQLMREFYGDVPFRPGEVDVLVASTAVFFFVPRKGNALDVPNWKERAPEEQQRVQAFFAKVDLQNNAETRRFPAFGFYEPEGMSEELLGGLARAAGVPEEVVKATLSTMFSMIPSSLHAQYLVHDLWGHTWQEAVNEFESEYALLPQLDRSLRPADGPEFGGEGAPTFGSAFVAQNGRVTLDEARLLAFADADLRGRIRVATSVPLSEVLADFMESKFSRARPALELPTSSLIPSTSLKIDLTIADTRAQVRRYAKPYRKLAVDPEERARLCRELVGLGLPYAGLEEAVVRAGRSMWLAFAPAFDDTLVPEPAEGRSGEIRSTVLRRLLLQFALTMVDFERALEWARPEAAQKEPWRDPATCPDFLAVAFTHFYEQDRAKNFWHIDQVSRNEFAGACERLRRALAD
jgi:hypothetical protein